MKYKPKTLSSVQVVQVAQVAQVVKALLLLGEEHITIEAIEKDRYAITTKRNGPTEKKLTIFNLPRKRRNFKC